MRVPIIPGREENTDPKCKWCGRNRGSLNGVLICPSCDFNPTTIIPNENQVKDVDPRP